MTTGARKSYFGNYIQGDPKVATNLKIVKPKAAFVAVNNG